MMQQSAKVVPQNTDLAVAQQPADAVPVRNIQAAAPAAQTNPAGPTPSQAASTYETVSSPLAPDLYSSQIDIWQRIRNGYGMAGQDSKLIARYEQWYASRPDYVERMTDRGRRYLYFIVEEVEKRGMPMEIALLPMIESAFYPVLTQPRALPESGNSFHPPAKISACSRTGGTTAGAM